MEVNFINCRISKIWGLRGENGETCGGCAESDTKDVNVWKNLTLRSGMKSIFSECNDGISGEVVNRLGCSNLEPNADSHK